MTELVGVEPAVAAGVVGQVDAAVGVDSSAGVVEVAGSADSELVGHAAGVAVVIEVVGSAAGVVDFGAVGDAAADSVG